MDRLSLYRENAIATQPRGRLIVLLYEGAIKALKRAVEQIDKGDHEEKARCLTKAIDIITELNASLDVLAGGEVAGNLRGLYLFMTRHLNQAHARNDPQAIREVIGLLESLNDAWKAIV